tara:strand:- start:1066 stop:1365 length:300 start_codon:yes stop_codon:yes gene_type:complete
MSKSRRTHSNEFKARIALEAQMGLKTVNEIAAANGLHANMVSQWKSELIKNAAALFDKKNKVEKISDCQKDELLAPVYKEVGKLQVENEWLKKKLRPYL